MALMHLTNTVLDDLERRILQAVDLFAEPDPILVGAAHAAQAASALVYERALDLLQMARELNYTNDPSKPKGGYHLGDNERAIYDYDMPDFVRAFLAMHALPAMEAWSIRSAGYMPILYGRYNGKPVRVVMVSRFGDVGVTGVDVEFGYYERCSIYEVTEYALAMLK